MNASRVKGFLLCPTSNIFALLLSLPITVKVHSIAQLSSAVQGVEAPLDRQLVAAGTIVPGQPHTGWGLSFKTLPIHTNCTPRPLKAV